MNDSFRLRDVTWPVAALVFSLAMLAAAHAFERFMGLPPCPLCLNQREVYWAVAAMATVGIILWRVRPRGRFLLALHVLLGLAFLTGAVVAGFHAGGEWGLWDLPASCSGTGAAGIVGDSGLAERLGQPTKVVSCEDPAWVLLGLSMAGWNTLASLAFAAASFWFAGRVAKA